MKHIKRFNEELSPSTYIKAGVKLNQKGHIKRGDELIKYSGVDSQQFTIYSIDGTKYIIKYDPNTENVFIADNDYTFFVNNRGINSTSVRYSSNYYFLNRNDAFEFIKFMKSIGYEHKLNINDFYREDIEK